ncbi:unnamed protein product [marine sediment metagenome]|uniref:Uncharacterized protein n=1 Tax=marine sediment metagenome TaxID=412755 RepID=X1BY49_9ZZZZ
MMEITSKNKKGGAFLGESSALFLAAIIIGILALVVGLMTYGVLIFDFFGKAHENIEQASLKETGHFSLFAYLSTPVNVSLTGEEIEMKIAELIRLASINNSYAGLLKAETKKIFDQVYENYAFEIPGIVYLSSSVEAYSQEDAEVYAMLKELEYECAKVELPDGLEVSLYLK